jgi:hypothetical protein
MIDNKLRLTDRQKEEVTQLEIILKNAGMHARPLGRSLVWDEHRTHQQTVVRNTVELMIGIAQAMTEMPGDDDRNAASKAFCMKFMNWIETESVGMPYI